MKSIKLFFKSVAIIIVGGCLWLIMMIVGAVASAITPFTNKKPKR